LSTRDLRGERGERALDRHDLRRMGARHRQREQRHHAIGLDLEEPLQHPSRLEGDEMPIEDQEAHEAVAVDPEIGERDACGGAPDLGADDIAVEMRFDVVTVGRLERELGELCARRDDRLSGDRGEPALGKRSGGKLAEPFTALARREECVAGELGMALPFDTHGSERRTEVRRIGRRRRHAELPAQLGEVKNFALALIPVERHREILAVLRRRQRLVRTRVHLVRQHDTLRMVGRQVLGAPATLCGAGKEVHRLQGRIL
jgi:hypothetical protein